MKKLEFSFSTRGFLMAGFVLLLCSPIVQRVWADPNADNPSTKKMLDQARAQAELLDRDANRMTGLLLSDVSWQGHVDELARVKDHVNDLGKLVSELQSSRSNASPAQRESIDRVVPLLREVAADTTKEINYLNGYQHRPIAPKYAKWVDQNAKAAHELDQMVAESVQYGEDRGKLDNMSGSLDRNNSPAQ